MRKDLFVLGTRLVGLLEMAGSIVSLAYVVSDYIGYIHPQGFSHEYYLIRFVVEFLVGLFLLIRPNIIVALVEFFAPSENTAEPAVHETRPTRSKAK